MFKKKRIYLDFASITPIDSRAAKLMAKSARLFANPSSLYKEGVEAKKLIGYSRKEIASLLSALPDEIIFTSGGTEGNNIAILGAYTKALEHFAVSGKKPHLIVSSIEHSSVLEVAKHLSKQGVEVTFIDPDENGLIDPKKIRDAIRPETFLVSVQYVNNEIGTIQPVAEIAKAIRHFQKHFHSPNPFPLLHTDACQAFEYLDINTLLLHIDLLTLDGTKVYGPRGMGVLYKKRGVEISALIHGGGQESGLRSGTENVAGAVGLAEALKISERIRVVESKRLKSIQTYFFKKLKTEIPEAVINGSVEQRLPNNINFCVPGLDAEFRVLQLDAKGICVSSASSCLSKNEDSASYVVKSLGRESDCSKSSIRVSFGRLTKKSHINSFFKAWKEVSGINI